MIETDRAVVERNDALSPNDEDVGAINRAHVPTPICGWTRSSVLLR